jgi:hypothetical protein
MQHESKSAAVSVDTESTKLEVKRRLLQGGEQPKEDGS